MPVKNAATILKPLVPNPHLTHVTHGATCCWLGCTIHLHPSNYAILHSSLTCRRVGGYHHHHWLQWYALTILFFSLQNNIPMWEGDGSLSAFTEGLNADNSQNQQLVSWFIFCLLLSSILIICSPICFRIWIIIGKFIKVTSGNSRMWREKWGWLLFEALSHILLSCIWVFKSILVGVQWQSKFFMWWLRSF